MNVNCYYIVYFSAKSFCPHFRSFETCSCVISYCAAFVCRHFPMMQCELWPLLRQSLVAHRIVKRENQYLKDAQRNVFIYKHGTNLKKKWLFKLNPFNRTTVKTFNVCVVQSKIIIRYTQIIRC